MITMFTKITIIEIYKEDRYVFSFSGINRFKEVLN